MENQETKIIDTVINNLQPIIKSVSEIILQTIRKPNEDELMLYNTELHTLIKQSELTNAEVTFKWISEVDALTLDSDSKEGFLFILAMQTAAQMYINRVQQSIPEALKKDTMVN